MQELVDKCIKVKLIGTIFQGLNKILILRFLFLETVILILLNEIKHFFKTGEHLAAPTISDRLLAVRQHAEWSAEWKGERLGLVEMRQHYSNYFRGIPHFKDFRRKFLEVFTLQEMDAVIQETQEFYAEYQAQV